MTHVLDRYGNGYDLVREDLGSQRTELEDEPEWFGRLVLLEEWSGGDDATESVTVESRDGVLDDERTAHRVTPQELRHVRTSLLDHPAIDVLDLLRPATIHAGGRVVCRLTETTTVKPKHLDPVLGSLYKDVVVAIDVFGKAMDKDDGGLGRCAGRWGPGAGVKDKVLGRDGRVLE